MASADQGPFFVRIGPSILGRRAGGSAADKAEELRRAHPWRSRLSRLVDAHTDERAWRMGAKGESVVGRRRARLPADLWYTFNDIPVGQHGANVDHLVIGPGGVFSLNAKNLTGKVWVTARTFRHNGYRTDFLPKANHEATRVARLLTEAVGVPVSVRGVLVMVRDDFIVKVEPADVSVVACREIRSWLERRPPVLDERATFAIAAKAHRAATWAP